MIHLARKISIELLLKNLEQELKNKAISQVSNGNLDLYCYTNRCVYNQLWNDTTLISRGLIIDRTVPKIVATPFPKFFNYGEQNIKLPNEEFEVTEKLDGSLIICYYYNGWQTATKGNFFSVQAQESRLLLEQLNTQVLVPGVTYLFEYIAPSNKIVIEYKQAQLILLSAYTESGRELTYQELIELANQLGTDLVKKRFYTDFSSLLQDAEILDKQEEGFVIRFHSGLRLKIKGREYRRIHKILTGITPLGIWESMRDGVNLEPLRQLIPEEYWRDWDLIVSLLNIQVDKILQQVEEFHQTYQTYSDKELGLILNSLPDIARKFLFPRRKQGINWWQNPQQRITLMNFIRPVDNQLEGYETSARLKELE